MKWLIVFACAATPATAQDATQRQRAALPYVIEQRNNALDGVALCQGDLIALQSQLAAAQKQLTDITAERDKLKSDQGAPQ